MTTVATITEADKRLFYLGAEYINYEFYRCKCGLAARAIGHDSDYKAVGYIVICDLCGDDDAWNDEVLTTYKQLA